MHPNWENSKIREVTVANQIEKILLFLESTSLFQAQTNFLLNILFQHNVKVVPFPYM